MATITAQDNATLAKKMFQLFNDRKLTEATQNLAPGYFETNVATGETHRGPEGFKKSAQGWIDAFPDARAEIVNQVATEDYVVTEFLGRGIHKGPMETPKGPIPATGKKIEIRFCEIANFKNGKIAEVRLYFDLNTMMSQLGISR